MQSDYENMQWFQYSYNRTMINHFPLFNILCSCFDLPQDPRDVKVIEWIDEKFYLIYHLVCWTTSALWRPGGDYVT